MALFKPFRGTRASLETQEMHDGYAYFCTDDGTFHIDYIDADGNLQRKQINAKEAETLGLHSVEEFLLKEDIKNTFSTGHQTTAGGRGFKVLGQYNDEEIDSLSSILESTAPSLDKGQGIYLITNLIDEQNKIDFEEQSRWEEFSESVRVANENGNPLKYSIVMNSARYHCGNILDVATYSSTSRAAYSHFIIVDYFEKLSFNGKVDDPDNCNVYNFLLIDSHPEFGNLDVGFNAVTFGQDTYAQNLNSAAFGIGSNALGKHSFVAGMYNIAGHNATAFGNGCYALGDRSFLAGHHLNTDITDQTIFGRYNSRDEDALFVIGCGTSQEDRKNALVVYKDGTTKILKSETDLDNVYLLDNDTSPLMCGLPIYSSSESGGWYVINSYKHESEMSNSEGTGVFDSIANGNELHAIIVTEEGVQHFSKVKGWWAHAADFSKIGFTLETYYPVTTNDTIVFAEYYNVGNPITTKSVPKFVVGNNNFSLSANGIVAGEGLVAYDKNSTVLGSYNKTNEDASFIVGNGTDDENRNNALEVYKDGHVEVKIQGESANSVVIKSCFDNLSNKVISTEVYDFTTTYHAGTYSRMSISPYAQHGSNIIVYIPMGWKVSSVFFNSDGTNSNQTISATDKDEIYELTYGEDFSDCWFDASLISNEEFNQKDCPITVTIKTDYIGIIEQDIEAIEQDITTLSIRPALYQGDVETAIRSDNSTASGQYAVAVGDQTEALETGAFAEGISTKAKQTGSHAEGGNTIAYAPYSHAEGSITQASQIAAHSEGMQTNADGLASHTEGYLTQTSGCYSHAEGFETEACGESSHTGGYQSVAIGNKSFAHGDNVIAREDDQFVIGRYNNDNSDAVFVVGNGVDNANRSNAFIVFEDGHAEVSTVGESENSVVTKKYLETQIGDINSTLDAIIALQNSYIGGEGE